MPGAVWNEKENRWIYAVYKDGKRKRFTSARPGPAGKREVTRKAREYAETGVARSAPTVEKLWPEFLQDVGQHSSPENVRNYEQMGRAYILPKVGKKKVASMSQNDWQQVINTAEGTKKKELSKKTLSNIRGCISAFLVYCFRCDLIYTKENSLYIPKDRPVYSKEILQPDDVRRLFTDEFEGEWYINIWRLMLLTGMRPGEVLGLQWSDIHGTSLQINRSINTMRRITPGKNKNARRMVPLSSLALEVLAAQKERTAHLGSEWVFCNTFGEKPCQSLCRKRFDRLMDQIGRPEVSPYGLRHTVVSMWKNAIPEQMIRDIVGHSSSMDTFGVYGHAVDGQQAEMSAALDAFYSPSLPSLRASRKKPEELPSDPSGAKITQITG